MNSFRGIFGLFGCWLICTTFPLSDRREWLDGDIQHVASHNVELQKALFSYLTNKNKQAKQ